MVKVKAGRIPGSVLFAFGCWLVSLGGSPAEVGAPAGSFVLIPVDAVVRPAESAHLEDVSAYLYAADVDREVSLAFVRVPSSEYSFIVRISPSNV